ncbi:MAG: FAD-dependent oxidoreductase [Kiritimatiellae bacterium]|nr:FAD-dependent oxidoreductase [Kiritimatiellia bacterium]
MQDGQVIWLEAEQFDELGGWALDSQFVELMGSPYLLANGVGRPVADAVTKAAVPAAGSYRLWVRCKDWFCSHHPGTFQVLVNGAASARTFGAAATDAWRWVDGGTYDLPGGEIEVRLHDLTGWWGRCDAVVLSAGGFVPSDEAAELAAQRMAHGGVSRELTACGPYDLVVAGGGLAGCAAAVAAARHGCRVALLEDRPVLGGCTSSEIRVPVGGDNSKEPYDPGESGIIAELDPGPGRSRGRSPLFEQVVRGEAGIDLRLNMRAIAVEKKGAASIEGLVALDVRTGQRLLFRAPLFADCTGHGWLGAWAGATCRHGREARSEFGESLAPTEADSHTMGNTLHNARIEDRGEPVAFEAPPWAYSWTKPEDFEVEDQKSVHLKGGDRPPNFDDLAQGKGRRPTDANGCLKETWWVEFGGMHDTVADAEWIRDELFRINIGLWDYVKNHDPEFKAANVNRELVWLNPVPGTRESRRILGDLIMTQKDFVERTVHPDTVAYGGWTIDIHHPQAFWVRGPGAFHAYRYKVSIPYRILYSRDIDNLFMAGRNVSCSHVALGGIRVMRTTALMGQAVGTAAAVARRHGCTPRGVYEDHIHELQQTLLKDGCYLIGVKNEDPADLARGASVSASSFASRNGSAMSAERVLDGRSRAVEGDRHAWAPDPEQPLPQWCEIDFGKPVDFDTVHVAFQSDARSAESFEIQARANGDWKTVSEIEGNALRRHVLKFDPVTASKLRLLIRKMRDDAAVCEIRAYGQSG